MEKIPLSPKDKAELKDIMISNTGACLLVMAILTGIYVVILKIDSDYFWIFHTIIWAIYLFFTYLIWTCWKDWKADYKWQKSGEIQDKKIKHSGGSSSTIGGTYAGGRMSSSSSSSISSSTTI